MEVTCISDALKWWCNSKIKRSKDTVTDNENVKIVLRAYLRQKCIFT